MDSLSLYAVTASPALSSPTTRKAVTPQPAVAKTAAAEPGAASTNAPAQPPEPPSQGKSMRFNLGGYDSERLVMEIYDPEKGTLIRTVPYEAMSEKTKGIMLNVMV